MDKKPALIASLESDNRMLDFAGAAMYKVREPKGSKRLTFDQISIGKQRRNRELAIQVITHVLQEYPSLGQITDPEDVKTYMATVMYQTLTPTKSEVFPLDQRTPFAKSYYREKATEFFYDFLKPYAEYSNADLPIAPTTQPAKQLRAQTKSGSKRQGIAKGSSKPSQELVDNSSPTSVASKSTASSAIGEPDSEYSEPTVDPTASSSDGKPAEISPPDSQATVIGCLLLVIVVLLILLLIQTF